MNIHELRALVRKARGIYRTQGLMPLLRRFFVFVRDFIFLYQHYYIFEHTLVERDEAASLPKIADFTLYIIRTDKDAAEVEDITGFELRRRLVDVTEKLEKGAVGFVGFVKGKFAHISWVAFSEEAKRTFDLVPYKVDFSNGQACTGGTYTVPAFRGKGLMFYGYFRRFQFLREVGVEKTRNAVLTGNTASLKVHAKLGARKLAEGSRLILLGFEFWKETVLVPTGKTD